MTRLFGTDGIRGEAGRYPMDTATVRTFGQALTVYLKATRSDPRVVVGRDTRVSGDVLESELISGIASAGGTACLTGVLPTPGVAYLTAHAGADAGVVISASHNPYRDNGLKVFSAAGAKLSETQEREIEALVFGGDLMPACGDARSGSTCRVQDASAKYTEFVKGSLSAGVSLDGVKVVLDTANGATHQVAPALFSGLGADVTVINDMPDGVNINEDCGSQHTAGLSKMVLKTGAEVGLAFDGDGDRLIAVDEKGVELTGDHVLVICAKMLKDEGRLKNDLVVSTVMSNMGLAAACEKYGFRNHATDVGDRHVVEAMRRLGSVVGGEASGHTIFLEHHTTGDGMLTGVQLLAAMVKAGKPMSEMAGLMDMFPQELINVEVPSKPDIQKVPEIVKAVRQVEGELRSEGRVLVRYSGTEMKCRVMVEASTVGLARKYASFLAEVVRTAIR